MFEYQRVWFSANEEIEMEPHKLGLGDDFPMLKMAIQSINSMLKDKGSDPKLAILRPEIHGQ